MKVPDSGMPEETYWNSLFDIPLIIEWLDIPSIAGPIVEIGCGYGTFTLPVAQTAPDHVFTFDIEQQMIATAQRNIQQAGMGNVHFSRRDCLDQGTGLGPESAGMVLLFNILHFPERKNLLQEASRILKTSGTVAIIHWRRDIATPRGPANHLRPDREMILDSIAGLDLLLDGNDRILEPYHWGMKLMKRRNTQASNDRRTD